MRWLVFLVCAIVPLISFNGKWRIGLDSAHYRGLADSLASGHGYQFGEFAASTIYPGLPVLLAGAQKAFGLDHFSPWQSIVLIVLMAYASLFAVYHLVRLHYPIWVATCVTCGVALNSRFVQLSQELLTDIPFLLGLVSSVLAWELMRRATTRGKFLRAVALAILGLFLAASMRPTFWILALAWIAVSTFELMRRRPAAATSLAIIVIVVAAVVTLDPRTRTWRIMDGGYEQEFLAIWQDAGADSDTRAPGLIWRLKTNIPEMIGANFAEAFTGQGLTGYGNWVVVVILIGGTCLMARRHPLYAVLIFATLVVTLSVSTTPRYYLMIMPFLLLAWIAATLKLIGGEPQTRWQSFVLVVSLCFVTLMNVAKVVPFVIEQRGKPFYQHYGDGRSLTSIAMAAAIRANVADDSKVIGPRASVLHFLSGREVKLQRDLLPPRKSPKTYPLALSKSHVEYAIFPAEFYRKKEPDFARMIDKRIIRPIEVVAAGPDWTLAKVRVALPPPETADWRTMAPMRKVAKTPPKRTPEQIAAAAKRAEMLHKKELAARRAANERKAQALKKAEQEQKRLASERKAAAERKVLAEKKADQERKRLAAERRAAMERRALAAKRHEQEQRRAAAEARERKAAKERKAKKAATQSSYLTDPPFRPPIYTVRVPGADVERNRVPGCFPWSAPSPTSDFVCVDSAATPSLTFPAFQPTNLRS